jgi:ATP-binding cassette subfamily B protein
MEKTRVLHDVSLTPMASSMLTWAVYNWINGQGTPGDVVMVSALNLSISLLRIQMGAACSRTST